MIKITLFVPVLNEIDGVRMIFPRIKREWVDEFVIIDGHSTDGTREYLESLGFSVSLQKQPGAINAWWEGFEAATGDVIIPFSPDNNSVPELIPELIEKIRGGYDMVIASRYLEGVRSEDDNLMTAMANRVLTGLVNLLFGASYTDALVMYRAFRKDLIERLGLNRVADPLLRKGGNFEILLSIRCAKTNLRVTEIPGDEPRRVGDHQGSKAHPGALGRVRGGWYMLQCIVRELFRQRTGVPKHDTVRSDSIGQRGGRN